MEKTPVILDVDTGIDDAIAIIHALASKDLNVLGISTVAGNQTVDKTTHNTLALVDFLGRAQVPVAMGIWLHGHLADLGIQKHSRQNFPLEQYPEIMILFGCFIDHKASAQCTV